MHLYRHNLYKNEVIEFVGLANSDLVFRYLGEENKKIYFNIKKADVKIHWVKIKKEK